LRAETLFGNLRQVLRFPSLTESLIARRAVRYSVILSLDALAAAAALYLAFAVRFEGRIPSPYREMVPVAIAILVPIRIGVTLLFGLHRWSFRLSGFYEAVRLGTAALTGSAGFVAVFYFFQRLGPPRSVILLEFFMTSAAMAALRFSPRLASGWYVGRRRSRQEDTRRTIIVGAGSAGDLLCRDLLRSDEHRYRVVGFLDDDPRKIGTYLGGRPVLGRIEDLPRVIQKNAVAQVLIAIPRLSPERIQTILRLCSSLKVHFKIIPVSYTYLNERITASMLHDLSPEDLLPRDPASFDTEEIRQLISGKRLLITGAAGSIGSEIARQVSQYGPESLVLVDINENDLYFLYREFRELKPEAPVVVEVANIRDGARLMELGRRYRPHFVFHAAAHKHVPLMEGAPAEAVKNNVFGTLQVAEMADRVGAERFVFVSTDKAVHPSSVMGATKRVAEMVIRDFDRRSRTSFTAVRFGNVLGSAGSVVPLFRRQIERGGPVTVTHPDCTRYFMTISEAVGLVLLAGLSGYGDLCILDMGQPIRIVDLASHMITMAGLVPGEDIRVDFVGLRPGEKLREELMTEEEEETHTVRQKIYAARGPAPPEGFVANLEELRQAADRGETNLVLLELKKLVPTFHQARVEETEAYPAVAAKGWDTESGTKQWLA
jgi:FlaA1/EpsC-like NDP-sugar epimerase